MISQKDNNDYVMAAKIKENFEHRKILTKLTITRLGE